MSCMLDLHTLHKLVGEFLVALHAVSIVEATVSFNEEISRNACPPLQSVNVLHKVQCMLLTTALK